MTDEKRIEWTTTEQPAPVVKTWLLRAVRIPEGSWRDATPEDLAAAGYVPRDNGATDALDAINKLCGCERWDYPGQIVRDVADLKRRLEEAETELVEYREQVSQESLLTLERDEARAELERAKAELAGVRRQRDAESERANRLATQLRKLRMTIENLCAAAGVCWTEWDHTECARNAVDKLCEQIQQAQRDRDSALAWVAELGRVYRTAKQFCDCIAEFGDECKSGGCVGSTCHEHFSALSDAVDVATTPAQQPQPGPGEASPSPTPIPHYYTTARDSNGNALIGIAGLRKLLDDAETWARQNPAQSPGPERGGNDG